MIRTGGKVVTKKAGISLLTILTVLTVLLAGCGAPHLAAEIKIGANLELSGGTATFGQSTANGIKLAVKEVNAAGGVLGKRLSLVIMDNQAQPATATSVATQLITRDKVRAIIGAVISADTLAFMPVATAHKIPVIATAATNPQVTVQDDGRVREWVFRSCFIDPFQGTVMAHFARETLQATRVAIYVDGSSAYARGLSAAFADDFTAHGGQVVAEETFGQKEQEFRAALARIKAAKPDVIFIPGYYQEVGLIVKQARALGIAVPLLGGDGWDSPQLVEIAGAAALNNTYFSNHYSPADQDPCVVRFVQAYQREYGQVPDAFAALGYDAVMMLVDAITRAGSDEPAAIRAALARTKDLQVVTGRVTLDSWHNPVKSAVVIEMRDGQQVFKEKINP